MDEASRVALRKVILGLFTPSYGRFSFTKSSGEPGDRGEVSERAPLAAEQATGVVDPRKTAEVHAAAAWWRDQIPTREDALLAAEGRCRDADQIASDAQATLDQLLVSAYAHVQLVADAAADRRVQP